MKIENAMVLAAGLGTRMKPLTDAMPKPLIKIAGKPMIDYSLDSLASAGVKSAVVNVHHHADQMLAHLAARSDPQIIISDERAALMNSGGGLAKGLKLLPRSPIFVMNADLFWIGEDPNEPSNLEKLAAFFNPERMDMALLCVKNENTTGHNGTLDFSMSSEGCLTRYSDGQENPVVYAGAIAMMPSFLDDAPNDAFNLNIYFDRAISNGRLFGMELKGHWVTVGTPDAIGPAERAVTRFGGT